MSDQIRLTYNQIKSHPFTRLNSVQRYSSVKLLDPENVAEHTCKVAILALTLGTYFNKLEGKEVVNIKEVVYKGAIHDLGEAFVPDIITSTKKATPEINKAINDLEHKRMIEDGRLDTETIDHIEHAKEWDSLEGILICLCDRLDATIKIDYEYHAQRSEVIAPLYEEIIENMIATFDQLIELPIICDHPQIKEYLKSLKNEFVNKQKFDVIQFQDYSTF